MVYLGDGGDVPVREAGRGRGAAQALLQVRGAGLRLLPGRDGGLQLHAELFDLLFLFGARFFYK